jgi:hypothetical protein
MTGGNEDLQVRCPVCHEIIGGYKIGDDVRTKLHGNNMHPPCEGSNCHASPI